MVAMIIGFPAAVKRAFVVVPGVVVTIAGIVVAIARANARAATRKEKRRGHG